MISGGFLCLQVMQLLVAVGWVYEETKSELALRADQPTGTLDEPTPQGVKAHKAGRFSRVVREGGWAIICSSRPRLWARSVESR